MPARPSRDGGFAAASAVARARAESSSRCGEEGSDVTFTRLTRLFGVELQSSELALLGPAAPWRSTSICTTCSTGRGWTASGALGDFGTASGALGDFAKASGALGDFGTASGALGDFAK